MGRILTLMKEDVLVIIGAPVLALFIPVVVIILIHFSSVEHLSLGLCGINLELDQYDTLYIESVSEGVDLLEKNEIDVFYDGYENKVYAGPQHQEAAYKLYASINNIDIATESSGEKKEEGHNLFVLFLLIIMLISTILTTTILTNGQELDIIKSYLTTPLTYSEYLGSKFLVALLGLLLTIGTGLLVSVIYGVEIENLQEIMLLTVIGTLFLNSIGMLVNFISRSQEGQNIIELLYNNVLFTLFIYGYQSGFQFRLPIAHEMKMVLNKEAFPVANVIVMCIISVLAFKASSELFRRRLRA